MLVLSSYREIAAARVLLQPRRVVVIGNFDGVHRGHKALLAHARELARTGGPAGGEGSVVVLTFAPHPARLLAPQLAPPLLSSTQRKRELLAVAGVDVLVEQTFDRAFSQLSPAEFVEQVLLGSADSGLGASAVVVGYDFSFGKSRAGNTQMLAELLARHGATVSVMPPVSVADPVTGSELLCSSTLVRQAVQAGQPERAALLLGHDPELEGEVVHGAGRGRTIGVPTANLRCTTEVLPAVGVYAAWAELLEPEMDAMASAGPGGELLVAAGQAAGADVVVAQLRRVRLRLPAAVNVGYNPTFTSSRGDSPVSQTERSVAPVSPISIEAHLLQSPGEPPLPSLYGQTLRLRFVTRVRAEQKFPSVAALVAQIGQDVREVAGHLGVSR